MTIARTIAELEAARRAEYGMSADQLKVWRVRMNLSADGAAVVLGVSVRTYQAWEYARRPVPLTAAILADRLERIGLFLHPAERLLLEPIGKGYRRSDKCAAS